MKSRTVGSCVLDTNIYIQLNASRFADICASEQQRGITAYANPWAIFELIAHFHDEHWPRSLAALKRMYKHCVEDDAHGPLRIMADSEDQLCKVVFGQGLSHRKATIDVTCNLVHSLSTGVPLSAAEQQLAIGIRSHVADRERLFESDVDRMVAAVSRPGSVAQDLVRLSGPVGARTIARAMRVKAESLAERTVPSDQQAAVEDRLMALFRWPICFWRVLLRRVLQDGQLVSDNANWIWDHQVAHLTSERALLNDQRLVVITDDGALIEAAEMAEMRDVVLRLPEYLDMLTRLTPRG